ncbi:MobC family plasmid mobilization relaxosome protein [Tyzzerella sp. OttesenSCG-928-J15]|nr:MobC family plasmid mobilization relaxosome protein [Tyzzerella sp. OttesenSCG-928-J15]
MANKNRMFAFRISERDYLSIKSKAEKSKLTMTEFITKSALNKNITVIDGLENVNKELKHIGRNLNQLTTLCNMGKIQCPELQEVKNDFKKAYEKLYEISEAA